MRLEIEPGAGYYDNISDNEKSVALIIALSHVCIPLIIYLTIIQRSSVSQTNRGHCLISARMAPQCPPPALSGAFPVSEDLISPETLDSRARSGTYSQNDLMRMQSSC